MEFETFIINLKPCLNAIIKGVGQSTVYKQRGTSVHKKHHADNRDNRGN